MIAPFFGVFLAIVSVEVEASWQKLQVKGDGIEFDLGFESCGGTNTYQMEFAEDGVQSVYTFQADGCVTSVEVGSERYEPVYDSSADLVDVVQKKRRSLAEGKEEYGGWFDGGAVFGNRRLSVCDDCIDTWDALCDEGAPCVCELLKFESNLSEVAKKSITTMCEKFGGGLCSDSGGAEICAGQCEEDGSPAPASTLAPAPTPASAPTPAPVSNGKNMQP